jgi:hypothetical protein
MTESRLGYWMDVATNHGTEIFHLRDALEDALAQESK